MVRASTVISLLVIFINLQNAEITTDTLTGLFNRRQLMPYLSWKARRRDGRQCSYVVLMDLNGFKQINDKFGHTAGDQAPAAGGAAAAPLLPAEDFRPVRRG